MSANQSASQTQTQINTHTFGWTVLSFLISLLWLKIDNVPLFPLGFVVSLVAAYWSSDIDKALKKQSQLGLSIGLAVIGTIIGFIVR